MEIKSFYFGPVSKVIIVGILIVSAIQYRYIGEKIRQAITFIKEKTITVNDPDGFNETSFGSREEEVAYIREYLNYKIGLKIKDEFLKSYHKKNPQPSKNEAEAADAGAIYNVTIMSPGIIEPIMLEVIDKAREKPQEQHRESSEEEYPVGC